MEFQKSSTFFVVGDRKHYRRGFLIGEMRHAIFSGNDKAATVNSAKSAVDAAAAAAANLGKAPPEVRPAFSAYLVPLMHQAEFLLRSLD